MATGSILISPLTLIMVEMGASRAQGAELSTRQILTAVRRAITKPVVLAPAAGILLSLSDVSLDALAHACLALIGSAAAGVALFLTGAILSAQSFRLDWRIVAATAASDVVRPLLAIAVIHFIRLRLIPRRLPFCLPRCPRAFSASCLPSTTGWIPRRRDPWSSPAPDSAS
ncbi:AEC family transporter [Bradyrhizobium sp. YCK136]|uniref:AEC family transporter n=1 Tax=Bradyrhizobium sp. YCK136 TaxID=3351346 RepID=UPI0037CABB54